MLSLTALYIIIYKSSDDLVAGLTSPKCYDFAQHFVLFIYRLSCSRNTISNLARLHIIIISHIRVFNIALTSPDSCWLLWLRRFLIFCHKNLTSYIHNPFGWSRSIQRFLSTPTKVRILTCLRPKIYVIGRYLGRKHCNAA